MPGGAFSWELTDVPTLRVGMPLRTLRVRLSGTQSVLGCIPTRSVGTISVERSTNKYRRSASDLSKRYRCF
ncbi:hypothetical protein FGE05_20680 [Pseudomonas sp. ICMP22404]|nr:hypothetical protein FGE05_20680 [Pseudomonas sp. ICMP22404]